MHKGVRVLMGKGACVTTGQSSVGKNMPLSTYVVERKKLLLYAKQPFTADLALGVILLQYRSGFIFVFRRRSYLANQL